jgi:Spy/CpxP family protein refolding chaperone
MNPSIRRSLSTALLLGGLAFHAPSASASPPGHPRHHGEHGRGPHGFFADHAEQLGIDEPTLAKIREIADASKQRNQALEEKMDAARDALHGMLQQESPDEAAVMAQSDAISALDAERDRNRLRAMMQIHALLSPEQRAELVRLRAEKRPHHRCGGKGEGGGHCAGHHGLCAGDAERLCPEIASGPDLFACLGGRFAELSEECRDAVVPPAAPR